MAITTPSAAKRPQHAFRDATLSASHQTWERRAMRAYVLLIMLLATMMNPDAVADQTKPDSTGLTRAEIGGRQLSLTNDQGRCTLNRAGDPPVQMDMQWPCRFSEDKKLKVRIEVFRQSLFFMVERSVPMAAPSKNCLTDLQAVRLFKGQLEIGPSSRISACGPGHWDQKAFIWQFN